MADELLHGEGFKDVRYVRIDNTQGFSNALEARTVDIGLWFAAPYFCCMMVAGREFVKKHPAAAKRAVRDIVKATAIYAQEPERVARLPVERGIMKQYDYALQVVKELPYARWRDYDSEDTLRFYALRLHEAGMIKSSPQKIIAQGSDLRFVNELKKELKG